MTPTATPATIDDLVRVEGKAELIGGRIVHLMPGSRRHNKVGGRIFRNDAPTIAVEVRCGDDNGPAAEILMASKRSEYFEAGTKVVWDVDPKIKAIHCYRSEAPDQPVTFTHGQTADAEPAVPGWRMAVNDVFPG